VSGYSLPVDLSRRTFFIGSGGSLVAMLPAIAWAGSSNATEGLNGRWVFTNSKRERSERLAVIDAAADAMPLGLRDIARKRIARTNPVEPWIEINFPGSDASVDYPDTDPMRSPLAGRPARWRNREGSKVQVSHKLMHGQLVQLTDNGKGFRRAIFSVNSGGDRLVLRTHIESKYLRGGPVKYRLTYKRP
jgi:hypothetical protein